MPPKQKRRRLQSPTPDTSGGSDAAAIDFRLRLQSIGVPDEGPSVVSGVDFRGGPERVVEQFQADFSFEPTPPSTTAQQAMAKKTPDNPNRAITELTDAYTRAGSAIHAAAIERLILGHSHLENRITEFVTTSSTALECNDALYANISYPLASTLCSDANHASATVTKHLAKLASEIDQAEGKLKKLSQDLEVCLKAEDQAWAQLDKGVFLQPHAADTRDTFGAHETAVFREEVRDIVAAKSKMLEGIEQEYLAKCQAETERLLQRMRGRE